MSGMEKISFKKKLMDWCFPMNRTSVHVDAMDGYFRFKNENLHWQAARTCIMLNARDRASSWDFQKSVDAQGWTKWPDTFIENVRPLYPRVRPLHPRVRPRRFFNVFMCTATCTGVDKIARPHTAVLTICTAACTGVDEIARPHKTVLTMYMATCVDEIARPHKTVLTMYTATCTCVDEIARPHKTVLTMCTATCTGVDERVRPLHPHARPHTISQKVSHIFFRFFKIRFSKNFDLCVRPRVRPLHPHARPHTIFQKVSHIFFILSKDVFPKILDLCVRPRKYSGRTCPQMYGHVDAMDWQKFASCGTLGA